jgi:sterol desaturase/sphingolipid hydroxylase (fatty acid hydroxylase superfamily)
MAGPLKMHIYPFSVATILVMTLNMMKHDSRFVWIVGNHHLLHHKYPHYNFGEFWIDVMCGTAIPPSLQ